METTRIDQVIVDRVKLRPLREQVEFLINYLDRSTISKKEKQYLLQFEDILRDIKIANKKVGNDGDFVQLRVEEVIKMRLNS